MYGVWFKVVKSILNEFGSVMGRTFIFMDMLNRIEGSGKYKSTSCNNSTAAPM